MAAVAVRKGLKVLARRQINGQTNRSDRQAGAHWKSAAAQRWDLENRIYAEVIHY